MNRRIYLHKELNNIGKFLLVFLFLQFLPIPAASANQWTNLNPSQTASQKDGNMMAYDSESQRVIMYGDHSAAFTGDETWVYNHIDNTWTIMNPASNPGNIAHGAVVYDEANDRVILFGGVGTNNVLFGGTWSYDFNTNTWENRNPQGSVPQARRNADMAYDSQSRRIILYGGEGSGSSFGDTWVYNYIDNTWTNRNPPAPAPPVSQGPAMAYDSVNDRVIMVVCNIPYACTQGQTWAYDFESNRWEQRNTNAPSPPSGSDISEMVYDSQSRRIITINDDEITWAYNYTDNSWTNMNPGTTPLVHHFDMVYIPQNDRAILYAGRVGGDFGQPRETWSYQLDGGAPPTCTDNDGDGYGNPGSTACPNGSQTDCNDSNPNIRPGATEVCDGVDNDCDSQIDEGVTTTYYRDFDTDTYGNATNTQSACSLPSGYVTNSGDCNDNNANVNPGRTEVCNNGIDDNCNSLTDCSDSACSGNPSCVVCTENWNCTEWGACVNNQQNRTCTDLNNCGTTANRPPETQSCTSAQNQTCRQQNGDVCTSPDTCQGTLLNASDTNFCCSVQCIDNNRGDITDDRIVNVFDLTFVGSRFGQRPGDSRWDEKADDCTEDSMIDIADLDCVSANMAKTY